MSLLKKQQQQHVIALINILPWLLSILRQGLKSLRWLKRLVFQQPALCTCPPPPPFPQRCPNSLYLPRARSALSSLNTWYFMSCLLGTPSSPTGVSSQRTCSFSGLSSNVTASAKPSLTSLGEREHFLLCYPLSNHKTKRSVCSLHPRPDCLPSQLGAPWRAQSQCLTLCLAQS